MKALWNRQPIAILGAVLTVAIFVVTALTDALDDTGGKWTVGVISAGLAAFVTIIERVFVTPVADPRLPGKIIESAAADGE